MLKPVDIVDIGISIIAFFVLIAVLPIAVYEALKEHIQSKQAEKAKKLSFRKFQEDNR